MNKLLILSVMALMMPIVPALACFPDADEVLFAPALRGRTTTENEGSYGGRNFDRDPISMYYCELADSGFVVVNGKCYDQDAITDYDTEEECDADPICKAYFEQQSNRNPEDIDICKETPTFQTCYDDTIDPPVPEPEPSPCDCPEGGICEQLDCGEPIPGLQPKPEPERTDDPNHGEIIGDEELGQDEEEHQEEEEQGQEEPEETTETAE